MYKILLILILILLPTSAALAASLNLTATTINQVMIEVSSDQTINAVGIKLHFDPNVIQVSRLDFKNSICELFIEKIIDNTNGEIRISCGKPNPGISGQAVVAELTYKVLSNQSGEFVWDQDSHVLANDGLGTELLQQTKSFVVYPVLDAKPLLPSKHFGRSRILIEDSLIKNTLG